MWTIERLLLRVDGLFDMSLLSILNCAICVLLLQIRRDNDRDLEKLKPAKEDRVMRSNLE